MATRAESHVTKDHDEIRRWAEAREAQPACVRGTGGRGDIGMLRLDFPGFSGEESLEHISWDEWFDKFDERGLALLYQERTAGGAQSNFNKLVSSETANAAERGVKTRKSSRGSTTRGSAKRTAAHRGGSAKRSAASRGTARGTSRSSSSRGASKRTGSSRTAPHRDGRTAKPASTSRNTSRKAAAKKTTGRASSTRKVAAKKSTAGRKTTRTRAR